MPEQETTKVYCGTCGSEIPFGIDIGHECKPEQETRMTPKVKQWMRDAVSKIHVKACGESCKRSDCEKDVEEATKIIASEYSKAHPPAGESAGTDWKQLLMNVLNALEGRKEGWLSPAQHTKVLKEANEALNADVRAGESAHEETRITPKVTTFVCKCGRKLLVEGQVIGTEFEAHPPAGESCGKRFTGASGRSIFTCVLPKDHAGDCDDCPNRANLTIGESGDTFKCAKCKKLQPQADRCECGGALYNVTPEAGESALDIGKPSDGMIFWRDKFCAEENHHPAEIGKVSLDFAEWFASKCGESAHEDGWVRRATKSAPIMQDCMVVVRRYSEGIFLDQWQQVAWRRPDGRWIDDEDLVESSDRYDNRVIEFWHKLKALPSAPSKEKR